MPPNSCFTGSCYEIVRPVWPVKKGVKDVIHILENVFEESPSKERPADLGGNETQII